MPRLKNILPIGLCLALFAACSLPTNGKSGITPEPTPGMENAIAVAASTATVPRPTPTSAAVGTLENPVIVALFPGSSDNQDLVNAGKAFAEQLSEITGYSFVVVAPESNTKLIEALGRGNAHIAVLSPYAYALAYKNEFVNAAFTSLKSGEKTYGAQFIARTDSGFESYYSTGRGENTAKADVALSQFRDKKPCWPDDVSPSGYAIPVGYLAQNEIPVRTGAILQGQPTVVRAVYAGGICDFGATYIDARVFPAVLDDYPDVLEQVDVIWRIPTIIPYDVLVIAQNLSPEVALAIKDALFRITGMQAGRQVLSQAYGIENWERVTDAFYDEFRFYMDASNIDLESLLD